MGRALWAKQVQGWLGHHAASFTLDTYTHLLSDDLVAAPFFDAITASRGAIEAATRPTETGRDGDDALAAGS